MKCICCKKPIGKNETKVYNTFRLRERKREHVKLYRHKACDADPANQAMIEQAIADMEKLEKSQDRRHYLRMAEYYDTHGQPKMAEGYRKSAAEIAA